MKREQVLFEAVERLEKNNQISEKSVEEIWGDKVVTEGVGVVLAGIGIIAAIITTLTYKWKKFLEKLGIQLQSSIEELIIVRVAEESEKVVKKHFGKSQNYNMYLSLYFCRMFSIVCKLLLSGTYFQKMLKLYVSSGIVKGAVASSALKKYFNGVSSELTDRYNNIKDELVKPQTADRHSRISQAEAAADIERLELLASLKQAKAIAEDYMSKLPEFINQQD